MRRIPRAAFFRFKVRACTKGRNPLRAHGVASSVREVRLRPDTGQRVPGRGSRSQTVKNDARFPRFRGESDTDSGCDVMRQRRRSQASASNSEIRFTA